MSYAHQPGSEPISIPEQIPNPAVRPKLPRPEPVPPPREPVKIPAGGAAKGGRGPSLVFCLRLHTVLVDVGLSDFLVVDQSLDATLRQLGGHRAHTATQLLAPNF